MTDRPELGRRRGVFVPAHEVEAHLHNGWMVIDDLSGHQPSPGVYAQGWFVFDGALMAAPDVMEGEAA